MFTKLLTTVIACSLASGALLSNVQDQQKIQKTASKFMERKLEASREIVAGLALEDYNKISKSAQDLMLLSHEADWNVLQTDTYLRMSGEFRGSAERLRDSANAKNLDGSTLAYFEVTLNCVRCHKYVRQNKKSKQK